MDNNSGECCSGFPVNIFATFTVGGPMMIIYRVCPGCGLKVPVPVIVDFFSNVVGVETSYPCPGCGCTLVEGNGHGRAP